jgi:hypothetical protein
MNRGSSYFTGLLFFVQLQQGSLFFSPYSPPYTWVQHGSLPFLFPFSFSLSSPTLQPATSRPPLPCTASLPSAAVSNSSCSSSTLPGGSSGGEELSPPFPHAAEWSRGAGVGRCCARTRRPGGAGDDCDGGGARAPAAPPLLPGLWAAWICACLVSGGPSSSSRPPGLL